MSKDVYLSGRETSFPENELIVSKTDPTGKIVYVNDVFQDVSGYTEADVMGKSHSVIRHPDMPRCVFKLLWDVISSGDEIFAYVNNRAKNGDHYWVLAHVTPNFDASGSGIVGYHSNRRVPSRAAVTTMGGLYRTLLEEERRHSDRAAGLAASHAMLLGAVKAAGFDAYDRFIFSVING